MSMKDLLWPSGGILLIFCTILQVAPIRLNPWSALAKFIGRAINAEVLLDLKDVKAEQKSAREKLEKHIQIDDERYADQHRLRILQFNNELLRNIPHTSEDFTEVLAVIDAYDRYCREHVDYRNSRAVHAIANIRRVYDERLQKHDFL